jgi:aspartate aminotransferase-like enzyme
MVVTDRVLMGPGPCNPYPEATAGLTRPLLGHLDPEFISILDETCERLRTVWGTHHALTLPVSGTGSAGMEAAFVNTVGPGDVVVIGVNGLFGERMCDVAGRCGAEVIRVDALLSAHPSPKLIALVHAETSTGVRNDVAAVAAGKGDALVLADCVTSLAGIPVDIDGWGVDVAYSGTQKCLGVAPGLAPFTLGARAWERRVLKPSSWYLDLGMIGEYTTGVTRKYHHTAPVAMVMSLHAALGAILDEGLPAAWDRHAECGTALQDGLEKMGLELWAPEGHRLPQLTTVLVPPDIDDATVRGALLHRYGIEIGGGVGSWAGRVWRIGCMGHTARLRNVTLLLAALAEILGR